MYISNINIYFYSTFNDKDLSTFVSSVFKSNAPKTEYIIPLSIVDRIYKTKGTLNIPNSIGIMLRSEESDNYKQQAYNPYRKIVQKKDQKYDLVFTSYLSRDDCFDLINSQLRKFKKTACRTCKKDFYPLWEDDGTWLDDEQPEQTV